VDWIPGEPNDGGGTQDCMQVFLFSAVDAIGWDDVGCTQLSRRFACSQQASQSTAFADFFISTDVVTFPTARDRCDAAGGVLVSDRTLPRHADLLRARAQFSALWLGAERDTSGVMRWLDDGSAVLLP
jgi:hypothetical protein